MNRKAIKYILLAQIASDGGKGIRSDDHEEYSKCTTLKEYGTTYLRGYVYKDLYIEKAIRMIIAVPDGSVCYYVDKEHNSNEKFTIIYFDIKVDNKRYQISFHSFKDWGKLKNSGRQTRWTKDANESWRSFEQLIKLFYK